MEPEIGGNSRWGQNEISAYPWAAHYVPVPGPHETLARELFEDLGVFTDGKWDERRLCFSPQERLFLHGRWQEGIEPEIASTGRDREDYRRFQGLIDEMRASGQFTIPMERGAKASPLDKMSMQSWMESNRFTSPYLNWYINYACRDDYGALASETSAWAGIHYFASREPEEKGPLVWPEGNGWIVRQLTERLKPFLHTSSPVYRISKSHVYTEAVEYIADRIIFAAPTFLSPLHRRGRDQSRHRLFALAHREPDAGPASLGRLRLGQRHLRFARAGLCGRDAHEPEFADRPLGLDVLLGAGPPASGPDAPAAARKGLELLARRDSERPLAGASRIFAIASRAST